MKAQRFNHEQSASIEITTDNKENKLDIDAKVEKVSKDDKEQKPKVAGKALVSTKDNLSKMYGLDKIKRQVSPSLLLDNYMER